MVLLIYLSCLCAEKTDGGGSSVWIALYGRGVSFGGVVDDVMMSFLQPAGPKTTTTQRCSHFFSSLYFFTSFHFIMLISRRKQSPCWESLIQKRQHTTHFSLRFRSHSQDRILAFSSHAISSNTPNLLIFNNLIVSSLEQE